MDVLIIKQNFKNSRIGYAMMHIILEVYIIQGTIFNHYNSKFSAFVYYVVARRLYTFFGYQLIYQIHLLKDLNRI